MATLNVLYKIAADTTDLERGVTRAASVSEKLEQSATTTTKAVNLQTASMAELDAIIAGTAVTTNTAASASGAYGSVLFATAEAETATAVAGGALTLSMESISAAVLAAQEALLLWGAAAALVGKWISYLAESSADWAVNAETAAAKQDVINKAISEGAKASITYADAIKFVNEEERHRQAMNPDLAAQKYIDKLSEQAAAAMRAAAEEEALNEGLAARGMVLNKGFDIQKLWNEEVKKTEEADKKATEAQRLFNASVQQASEHLQLTTYDLHRFNAVVSTNVTNSLHGVDTEIQVLASRTLPDFGIKLYDVGQKGIKSFGDLRTSGQKLTEDLTRWFTTIPMAIADAFRSGDFLGVLDRLGTQFGEIVGNRFGQAFLNFIPGLGGPLGAAIGSLLIPVGKIIANFFVDIFSFGSTIWGNLAKQIEDLIRKAKELAGAIGNTPSPPSPPSAPPAPPSRPEPGPIRVDPEYIPQFAMGSGGFRDFGAGTLAMLHGRERVVTESEGSGGGVTIGSINVNLTATPGTDGKGLVRQFLDELRINAELNSAIRIVAARA